MLFVLRLRNLNRRSKLSVYSLGAKKFLEPGEEHILRLDENELRRLLPKLEVMFENGSIGVESVDCLSEEEHAYVKSLASESLAGLLDRVSSNIENMSSRFSPRVFISHSSVDREVAARVVDLLQTALNLKAGEIRCTSVEGHRLKGGDDTEEALRADIHSSEVFVGLISGRSIESAYVLFELGARWGLDKYLLPLLAPGAEADLLVGPLAGRSALSCSNQGDLHQMVRELGQLLEIVPEAADAYQRRVDDLQQQSSRSGEAPLQDAAGSDTFVESRRTMVVPERSEADPKSSSGIDLDNLERIDSDEVSGAAIQQLREELDRGGESAWTELIEAAARKVPDLAPGAVIDARVGALPETCPSDRHEQFVSLKGMLEGTLESVRDALAGADVGLDLGPLEAELIRAEFDLGAFDLDASADEMKMRAKRAFMSTKNVASHAAGQFLSADRYPMYAKDRLGKSLAWTWWLLAALKAVFYETGWALKQILDDEFHVELYAGVEVDSGEQSVARVLSAVNQAVRVADEGGADTSEAQIAAAVAASALRKIAALDSAEAPDGLARVIEVAKDAALEAHTAVTSLREDPPEEVSQFQRALEEASHAAADAEMRIEGIDAHSAEEISRAIVAVGELLERLDRIVGLAASVRGLIPQK